MPGLITSFGCCLAKPGGVGPWEGQEGLGINLLCVAGPMTALLWDPGFAPVNTEVVMLSQVLLAPPLYDVLPPIHAAHLCTCDEAQDQSLILDLIKETDGRNIDMNWAEKSQFTSPGTKRQM